MSGATNGTTGSIHTMKNMHKHHIIQRYKCKMLGIDPDHPDNTVNIPREVHATVHWGYFKHDLTPLLEWCSPPQWILDNIELGNTKDAGAASLITEQHQADYDLSGKNNPNYKDGALVGQYKDPSIRKRVDKIRNAERHSENKVGNRHRMLARYYLQRDVSKAKEHFDNWQDYKRNMPVSNKGNYIRKFETWNSWKAKQSINTNNKLGD